MKNMYTHQPERALQSGGENLDGFQLQRMLQLLPSGSAIRLLRVALLVNLSSRLLFP